MEGIYTPKEIKNIIAAINKADQSGNAFRKTDDLFAIRRFLSEVPGVKELIFTDRLKAVIDGLFGSDYRAVKSIYFDKHGQSNWFVAWHQDITIAVDKKADLPGYKHWTFKLDQYAVQPPLELLQSNFTIRIHLDDTDEDNGALKVIPTSHLKGVYRIDEIDWVNIHQHTSSVKAGGVMIMRPLLMHASNRTAANRKRRVVHVEFSKAELPGEIDWAEKVLY